MSDLSPAQYLAWSKLIVAMHRAMQETRGLKVAVPLEQVPLLKRAFYQVRKAEPELTPLSLLTTSEPSEFLLYHPASTPAQEEIPNG